MAMDQREHEIIDWYEEDQEVDGATAGTLPGLPLSWHQLLWCLAARGFVTYSVFAGHIWTLLLVMGLCTLLLWLARPLKGLAYLLSGSAAVVFLFTHTF